MPAIHETAYPRLQSNYTEQALHRLFSPTEAEIQWARRRTREGRRANIIKYEGEP